MNFSNPPSLPSSWQTVRLGEAIEFVYGKSLPKNTRVDGKVPVYGSNGIAGWNNKALVNEPTIIVGRKGSAGAVQFVEEPCYPIDTTYFVRVRPAFSFDLRFLFYLLRKLDLSRLKTATGVPGLSRDDAYQEPIPVPPREEQHRLVDILSRAEGIVRLRREAQKKAQELIPALFLDMFGDPATNPKGWPVAVVGDVSSVQGGLQLSKSRESLPLEFPYLRVANVHRFELDLSEIKYIHLTESEYHRVRLEQEDLLVVEGHGNPNEIGRVGIWDGSIQECVHQNHLIRVRCNQDIVIPTFLWIQLNSISGRQELLRQGKTTSGLNTISVSNVKSARFMLPTLQLQRTFVGYVEQIRSIQSQQSIALEKAEATFQSLLHRAFAGQL